MKTLTKLAALTTASALLALSAPAMAKVTTGATAPDIQVMDANGDIRNLSEFAGKTKVLEWTNHQCPYVVKHYESGNMQKIQKQAAADGVVWLSVISSAPGKQGFVSGAQANAIAADKGATPTAILLDNAGQAGRTYAAKTTPHMYIINDKEQLVYQGAIDDRNSTSQASLAGATNYVTAALASMKAGTPIAKSESKPYGCSIKY